MPDISVTQPSVGLEARFTFKDPAARYIKSKLNTQEDMILLTATSISNMRELIELDMRNPFQDTYAPLGLNDFQYQEDLKNEVPLVTFKHTGLSNKVTHIRVPLNYIQDYDNVSEIKYINKLIVMDLGSVYKELDTSVIFTDLKDFITTRLGIVPSVNEVSIGEPESISQAEHETKETIRGNLVTVRKTLSVQLEEVTLKYDQVLQRLSDLNITLG